MNRRDFMYTAGGVYLASAMPSAFGAVSSADPCAIAPHKKIETFGYRGVTLLPSRFQRQMEDAYDVYFNMSNDDMLKGFRREAGLPDPGHDMTGWARRTSGGMFGQWISGMARLSCATNDQAMREKAAYLVEEWAKTIGPDGNCRMGTYAWEKMCCGLTDMALYAGHTQSMEILERITQWAMKNLDRTRNPATPENPSGAKPHGTVEWYTLSENPYRAYLLSGKAIFREFGDLWNDPSYWDKFLNSASPQGVSYLHAYSHVNTFCGPAMKYEVTGDPRYLRIVENAYDWVQNTQAYASGAYGPGERTVPADGTLGRALEARTDSAEIGCGSWAGFKLTRYLMSLTGKAHYGDWAEALLYNAIGAALPVRPDGRTFYYADYRLDVATKLYYWDHWPCCSGTYIQTVADYHNVIYFRDAEGVYVNLFVPSTATWKHRGNEITLRQETDYPQSGNIRLAVAVETPVAMSMRLRTPAWSKNNRIKINGEDSPIRRNADGWVEITRTWKQGDTMSMDLDLGLYAVAIDPQHPNRAAIKFGPVMLVQDQLWTYPLAIKHTDELSQRFTRISPDLQFKVSNTGSHLLRTGDFRPFYSFPERNPYRVYFDLDAPSFL